MKLFRRERLVGVTPDDDSDIRVIEDLSTLPGYRHRPGGLWLEVRSLFRDILFAGLVAVLIVVFVIQPVRVEGLSMMPRLHDQDRIFVNKFIYPLREWLGDQSPIKRGDIVVLLYPNDPSKSYIKRVVGLPGERIEVMDGRLYVDNELVEEPYLDADYLSRDSTPGPIDINSHHYYVMGDNRNNSSDSRSWGLVPEKYIYGKAVYRYYPVFPFERVGMLQ
jgi:signal peptidase I